MSAMLCKLFHLSRTKKFPTWRNTTLTSQSELFNYLNRLLGLVAASAAPNILFGDLGAPLNTPIASQGLEACVTLPRPTKYLRGGINAPAMSPTDVKEFSTIIPLICRGEA